MRSGCAIAILIVFGVSLCESLWREEEPSTEVREMKSALSEGDDILEDMIDYVIEENDIFEGRKKKIKKKKLMKFLVGAALLKALLLPKLLALVKFLTAKAYLISMMALVLAAAVSSGKKKEQNTEHIIDLMPKGRTLHGQHQAYKYNRRRRSLES